MGLLGNLVRGPAFDRTTTDAVIAAIENQVVLLDAQITEAAASGLGEPVELLEKKVRLQQFLVDYRSAAEKYHRRLAYWASSPPRSLLQRFFDRVRRRLVPR